MNGSKYIVDKNGERRAGCFGNAIRYGVGGGILALLLWVLFGMCGCKTVQVSEKVNVRDSVAIRYQDSTRWNIRDSLHIIEHHVTIKDSTGLTIQFGQGGGTYNAKTGEATNVAGVHQTDTHHEQRDSTAHYRTLASDYAHRSDSIANRYNALQTEYEKVSKQTRTGYDKFTSWFFWIVVVLVLLWAAYKICDKIPACKGWMTALKVFLKII